MFKPNHYSPNILPGSVPAGMPTPQQQPMMTGAVPGFGGPSPQAIPPHMMPMPGATMDEHGQVMPAGMSNEERLALAQMLMGNMGGFGGY